MSEICEIGGVKDIRGRAMKKHKATSVCTGCFFYDKSCPGQGIAKPIESGGSECYGTIWKPTKSTQKPKEPKTMTTKKPGTSHGKPTAKGLRVEKKPTATKVSKYPAPRVQIVALVPVKPLDKMTKLELIETYYALRDQFDNQAADHCIAGTKLDRALVDLKEAKKRIKELETLNAAATRLADDQRTEINRLQGARK